LLVKEGIPLHCGEEGLRGDLEVARRLAGREIMGLRRSLVASNPGIIIALARIYRLDLLEELLRKDPCPEAVWKEVTVEGKPGREKVLRAGFIQKRKTGNKRLVVLLGGFADRVKRSDSTGTRTRCGPTTH